MTNGGRIVDISLKKNDRLCENHLDLLQQNKTNHEKINNPIIL